jgi:hypothetical protein
MKRAARHWRAAQCWDSACRKSADLPVASTRPSAPARCIVVVLLRLGSPLRCKHASELLRAHKPLLLQQFS